MLYILILKCLIIISVLLLLIIIFKEIVFNTNDTHKVPQIDFEFKKKCREKGGVLRAFENETDPTFDGVLLGCEKRGEYDPNNPEDYLFSEIEEVKENIKNGEYNPKNEKERLILYFKIIYPLSKNEWENMSLKDLENYYQDLEFYYRLPPKINPKTKVKIHRSTQNTFYRMPEGIILDQDTARKGIQSKFIEVTRYGPSYALLRDPTLFNGTYYYPAKGSGLYLPLGNSLIAYNKTHALKKLDMINKDILKVAGRDFQYFLNKDSTTLWNEITNKDPYAKREDHWVEQCSVNKHDNTQDNDCSPFMGSNTQKIYYIPQALDTIIEEMTKGKSLRVVTNDKGEKLNKYYGLGDTGDKIIAQIAIERGYDTIQFLREAQMSLKGDAVVGNELLHLIEPSYSQSYLTRLSPFDRPYIQQRDPIKPLVNYLLDNTIDGVSIKILEDPTSVFDPYDNKNIIDVVVKER